MMKKIFIVGLIVCSFLVVSASSVLAADETHTVIDDTGDVVDSMADPVSENNIDLEKLTFTKNNKQVELKVELADGGIIQNSDYVYYEFILVTSENRYDIVYANDSCIIEDFELIELEDVEYSGAGTGTLTISFNLYSENERYMSLYAYTIKSEIIDEEESNYYFDVIPEGEIPAVYATFLETGKTGESIEFSAETDSGTEPYSWNWDFGDGETSDEKDTSHIYAAAGVYKVTLLVTDGNDYSDIYYATLNITANDNGNQNGGDNNGGDNDGGQGLSNSGLILFVVIIAIIAIAGTVVVIYIIRR
jgi:PKD repeat protein